MTTQQQAHAIGETSRYALFRYLAEHGPDVGVAELAAHAGLHHNAVRQHLAQLVDAKLVVESVAAPNGRGRPRLMYAIDPAGAGRWFAMDAYERLSVLLAEVIRTGDDPIDVGRRAGRAMAEEAPAARTGVDPVRLLQDQMARLGFAPERRSGRRVHDLVLHTCPYASAAVADPDAVCSLHLGIAEGFAERDGSITVTDLRRKDPRRAGCVLRCRVAAEEASATSP